MYYFLSKNGELLRCYIVGESVNVPSLVDEFLGEEAEKIHIESSFQSIGWNLGGDQYTLFHQTFGL